MTAAPTARRSTVRLTIASRRRGCCQLLDVDVNQLAWPSPFSAVYGLT